MQIVLSAQAREVGAIFRGGGRYIGWFKDPAGNVLAVLQDR